MIFLTGIAKKSMVEPFNVQVDYNTIPLEAIKAFAVYYPQSPDPRLITAATRSKLLSTVSTSP